MRNATRATVVATLLLTSASYSALSAQESTTRGFTLGVHLTGASLSIEGEDASGAGGAGIRVGYGLNRIITLFAQIDGARFDEQLAGNVEGDLTLGHVDIGGRFHFANSLRSWVPYLQAALGVRVVGVSDPIVDDTERNDVSFSGAGLSLGGGIDYYFSETLALDLQLLWTGGEFTTLRVDNVSVDGFDIDATSARLNLGIAWWP